MFYIIKSFFEVGDKITETNGFTNSIFKIIWFVSVFNFLFLGYLPFEEHVKGEEIFSGYIDSSKDIDADVTLTENEVVTIFFEPFGSYSYPELLKVVIVDPQNRKYSFENKLYPAVRGLHWEIEGSKDYFLFTPKVSGVHHIKISNAVFDTGVRLVSGMVNLYEQPFFLITLFSSFIITLTGLFSMRKETIMELMQSGKIVNDLIYLCLAIPISLTIVNNAVSL